MKVLVRDNNINEALKKLKKKLFNEGIIKETMKRKYYIKPSDEKRLNRRNAKRQINKEQTKRLIRYGLI